MITAKFVGYDAWSRPLFRSDDKVYYCLVDVFPKSEETLQRVIDEVNNEQKYEVNYKGSKREGEPSHPVRNVKLSL